MAYGRREELRYDLESVTELVLEAAPGLLRRVDVNLLTPLGRRDLAVSVILCEEGAYRQLVAHHFRVGAFLVEQGNAHFLPP